MDRLPEDLSNKTEDKYLQYGVAMECGDAIIDPAGVHYVWEQKGGEYATYETSFYHMTQQRGTEPPGFGASLRLRQGAMPSKSKGPLRRCPINRSCDCPFVDR